MITIKQSEVMVVGGGLCICMRKVGPLGDPNGVKKSGDWVDHQKDKQYDAKNVAQCAIACCTGNCDYKYYSAYGYEWGGNLLVSFVKCVMEPSPC